MYFNTVPSGVSGTSILGEAFSEPFMQCVGRWVSGSHPLRLDGMHMRLRTLRRAAQRLARLTSAELDHKRRMNSAKAVERERWQLTGSKDKKAAIDLVDVDFGFKEEVEHGHSTTVD